MADGAIRVKGLVFPITPNPPAGRYYLGVDAGDGHLKKQDPSGTIVDYDSGAAYTNEEAQDAVGAMIVDTSSVDLTYNDAVPSLSAVVLPAGVNHNALQNYVANEHVNHSSVQVATASASGLQGGGDLTATRNLSININGMTEKTSPLTVDDEVSIYDSVVAAHRKIKGYRLQGCNPDRYVFTYADFVQQTLGDLTSGISGTGASAQAGTYGIDLTENAFGVVEVDTGTTATGRSSLGTASINQLWTSSGTILRFGARLGTNLLSTGTDTYFIYAGFLDNLQAVGDVTDGAYFRYTDAANGGRWEAVVAAAATRQAFDTGVLASINYQIFEVEIDYTGVNPIVRFYIDGTLTNTVNTPSPIPVGPTQAFGYGWKIEKTVGTNQRNLYADWYCYSIDRSGAR